MAFALWTGEAVRRLVHNRSQISLPIRTVGLYLRRGASPHASRFDVLTSGTRTRFTSGSMRATSGSASAKAESAEIYWADETARTNTDVHGRGNALKKFTVFNCRIYKNSYNNKP
jgi:hypothetical protein